MGFFSKLFKGITNLIGDVIGFLVGADFDDQSQAEGVLVNKSSNIASIPVIYGTRKVGGTRVFLSTSGNDNEYLYMAIVLCEGEIDSIGDVYINDVLSTDNKYNGLVFLDKTKTGSDTQTYSQLLSGASDPWGQSHKLSGIAYLAIKLKWDQDVFGSIPDIKCVVNGRKVYDPRDANQDIATPSTWTHSSNPALCLRDYLTNNRFGKGLANAQIDNAAFVAAANTCDTLVTEYQGSTGNIKLLECNAVLDTNKTLFDNVKIMLQGMRGLLPYQDGKYSLLVDAAAGGGTRFRLDASNITSSLQVTASGKNKKFNRVRAKFVNPNANWQEDSVDWPPNDATYSQFLSEDNGEELLRNVTLNTITNYYSARDLARIICRASREHQLTVEITALPEALAIAVGDVVELEHESLGWTGNAVQEFRVLAMGLQENGEVKLTLQEYTNVYTWDEGAEEGANPDTNTPNPFEVAPIAGISLSQDVKTAEDGSAIPILNINFTASPDAFVVEYAININPQGFDKSEVRMTTAQLTQNQIDGLDPISWQVQPALVTTYTVSIVAINGAGVRSDPVSASINVTGDIVPPAAPAWNTPATYGGIASVGLSWTTPADDDFAYTEVERSSNGTSGWITLSKVFNKPSTEDAFVDTGLAHQSQYFYRLWAYDWSNNRSLANSGNRSATTLAAPVVDSDLKPREVHGYVYYNTAQAQMPATPSASGYNYSANANNNPLIGLTAGWSINPPQPSTISANAGDPFWVSRFYVTETTYNGTAQVQFSTPFESTVFDGLVTFRNLNTELAQSGTNSAITQIDGGRIRTGVIDLNTSNGMAVLQGKSSYTDGTAGFWLGNDNGPKFGIGTSSNWLRFDGSGVTMRGITVLDGSGNTILSSSGLAVDLSPQGDNLITNGGFNDGQVDWSTIAGFPSFSATDGEAVLNSGEAIQNDTYFYCVDKEPLYISIQAYSAGANMRATVVWYRANGTYTSSTVVPNAFDPPVGLSSTQMYVASLVPPTSATPYIRGRIRITHAGNTSDDITLHSVMVSRSPAVLSQDYAETYIRNAAIDTLQLNNEAVTVPDAQNFPTPATPFKVPTLFNPQTSTWPTIYSITTDWGPNWQEVGSVLMFARQQWGGILGSHHPQGLEETIYYRLNRISPQGVKGSPRGQVWLAMDRPGRIASYTTFGEFPAPIQQVETYVTEAFATYSGTSSQGYWHAEASSIALFGTKR